VAIDTTETAKIKKVITCQHIDYVVTCC